MEKMTLKDITREMIDFDKLHNEIRQVIARQKELTDKGVRNNSGNFYTCGWKKTFEHYKELRMKRLKQQTQLSEEDRQRKMEELELDYLSCRMTVLCLLVSHLRGRVRSAKINKKHYRYQISFQEAHNVSMGGQEEMIGSEWKDFLKKDTIAFKHYENELINNAFDQKKTLVFRKTSPVVDNSTEKKPGFLSRVVSAIFG